MGTMPTICDLDEMRSAATACETDPKTTQLRDLLLAAANEIEILRSLLGAVTTGPDVAAIKQGIRERQVANAQSSADRS